jgi:hypothetical protein|tara:strand:+ start:2857 stop:3570 length:714 start_codon:yes stop_codon:yes gene_type:complete
MTNVNEVLAEIEEDLAWREEELRYFENRISSDGNTDLEDRTIETKPLVLFLYAHFEGHAKLMFTVYVNALNSFNLNCKDVVFPLIASSLHSEFGALKNPDKKNPLFPKEHEPIFKELGRRVEFFENLEQILTTSLKLKVDNIVDTESNLKPDVLKKIFFRLGFDIVNIDDRDFSKINRLLQLRNNFAHGSRFEGISYNEYIEIKDIIWKVLREIKNLVIDYISNEKFQRQHNLTLTV